MPLLTVPIIAVLALLLSITSIIVFFIRHTSLKSKLGMLETQLQANSLLVDDIRLANLHSINELKSMFDTMAANYEQSSLENVQVSKQLEHRVKTLQQQLNDQQVLLTQIQDQSGEDKLYSLAFKLASKGVDIEEIMKECELPRPEVEMLMSMYQQKIRS
ncbi:MAG: DUF2802 domain-containing protein [Colwellia sp.]